MPVKPTSPRHNKPFKPSRNSLQDESNQNFTHSASNRIYLDLVNNTVALPILGVIRWKCSPDPKSFTVFRQKFSISFTESCLPKRVTCSFKVHSESSDSLRCPSRFRPNRRTDRIVGKSHPANFFDERTILHAVDAFCSSAERHNCGRG
jgi:hypothetical protein